MASLIDPLVAEGKLSELASRGPVSRKYYSLRKFVFTHYDKLEDLIKDGWSRCELSDYLRSELGIYFSDHTFFNYLSAAKKNRSPRA